MNGIQILASQTWIERLGWTLLHFLWQGTGIAVLYTIARFLFARYLSSRTLCALDAAQKFIGTQMRPVGMVCLMRNAGAGAEVLQDFTADRGRLLSVVATLAAG